MSDERIIDNIRKLKSLGMPNNEIIDNLINIGLTKEESEKLVLTSTEENKEVKSELQEKIKEIKENPKKKEGQAKKTTPKKPEKEEIPDDFFGDESGEIIDTSISDDLEDDFDKETSKELNSLKNISSKKKEEEEIDFTVDLKKDLQDNSEVYKKYQEQEKEDFYKKYITPTDSSQNTNTEEVWQKGLVTTINSKLTELENKQKTIEDLLKLKIDNEVDNIKKFQ
jgi:hypothetical protein